MSIIYSGLGVARRVWAFMGVRQHRSTLSRGAQRLHLVLLEDQVRLLENWVSELEGQQLIKGALFL